MPVLARLPAVLAFALSACANPTAGYNIQPGTPRQAVIEQMGQPSRVLAAAGGERLQYSLQPFGQRAWMVDLDASGRVVRARVLQSVPLLDAAALQTVYQWVFQPAVKHGRPVATIAQAPVAFRIY